MNQHKTMIYPILVDRLCALYGWPDLFEEGYAKGITVEKILKYPPKSAYIVDRHRTESYRWYMGRVRFFYERLLAGHSLDPICIDNVCDGEHIYPEPVVIDGHHRLTAAYLAKVPTIPATYGCLVSLRNYLTGHRKTVPSEAA